MKRAIYSGSFDPMTNGHLDIMRRASRMFDELTIGVVHNPNKTPLFSVEERVAMIESATSDLGNVSVDSFTGLLADYVNENKFDAVVRGLRATSDFEYEIQMAQMNAELFDKGIESVFLMTSPEYSFISSSMIKEVVSLGGNVENLIPEIVLTEKKKFSKEEVSMTVLELLEELEEIINTAPKVPLASKVMVDANEILELSKDIRLSLPDDVQQAKWVIDEKERIHQDARNEYERIIVEAKKQADTMVESDVITERAKEVAGEIYRRADEYSKNMRLRTYDYMNEVLSTFRDKMDDINNHYFTSMYEDIDKHFSGIAGKIESDLVEIQKMTESTQEAPLPVHNIEAPVNSIEREPEEEDLL